MPAAAFAGDAEAVPLPSVLTVTVNSVGAGGASSSKIALIATLVSGMRNLLLVITSPRRFGSGSPCLARRRGDFRFCRRGGSRTVAAAGHGDGVLGGGGRRVLPQRLDCDVSGDGHGAFTGYSVPSISHALNCFPWCDELALRQIILRCRAIPSWRALRW